MATVAPSAEKAADLLQNLALDPQKKTLEVPEPVKKTSVYQYGTTEPGISANGQIQSSDRSVTPFFPDSMDPTLCYLPNGYPSPAYLYGYNATGGEWDDFSRYMNADGSELTPGVFGENGSVMFHNGYGYATYGPYSPAASPVPTVGNDSLIYGPQHYQYPAYFQPSTAASAHFIPTQVTSSQAELSATTAIDQKPFPAETAKGNSTSTLNGGVMKGKNGSTPYKPSYQNSSINVNYTYGRGSVPGSVTATDYNDVGFGLDGQYKSTGITSSFSKPNNAPSSRNHNFLQNPDFMSFHHPGAMSGMGSTTGYVNRVYPNKFYGQYGNTFRSGVGFGSGGYDSRTNANRWLAGDGKYKTRGRGNGAFSYRNENVDGLNELNRGPRVMGFKNQKGFAPSVFTVKGQNVQPNESVVEEKDDVPIVPDRERYNKADFPEDYIDAKFFVIKSYSEDDIHKSIKYSVWASTPNGNKKLDAAYQEAQQKSGGCPVFLFFSVNTSGQFVGVAEMVGPVDFHKNLEYWQQDKWTGCFSVKWHIVKDVPNGMLKHIILEYNENKPVTNSRDTQEVKLEHGLKMIKIFKDYAGKTCILDDFGFYEKRQKIIQDKKAKQQQYQQQASEDKPGNEKKEVENGLHDSLEIMSDVVLEPTSVAISNGDLKNSDNGSFAKTGDTSKVGKAITSEKSVVTNGVANGF